MNWTKIFVPIAKCICLKSKMYLLQIGANKCNKCGSRLDPAMDMGPD